jgi:hypothetical protein
MGTRAERTGPADLSQLPNARIGNCRAGDLLNADASTIDRKPFADEELYRLKEERGARHS